MPLIKDCVLSLAVGVLAVLFCRGFITFNFGDSKDLSALKYIPDLIETASYTQTHVSSCGKWGLKVGVRDDTTKVYFMVTNIERKAKYVGHKKVERDQIDVMSEILNTFEVKVKRTDQIEVFCKRAFFRVTLKALKSSKLSDKVMQLQYQVDHLTKELDAIKKTHGYTINENENPQTATTTPKKKEKPDAKRVFIPPNTDTVDTFIMTTTKTGTHSGTNGHIGYRYVYTDGTRSAWSSNIDNKLIDDFKRGAVDHFFMKGPMKDPLRTLYGLEVKNFSNDAWTFTKFYVYNTFQFCYDGEATIDGDGSTDVVTIPNNGDCGCTS